MKHFLIAIGVFLMDQFCKEKIEVKPATYDQEILDGWVTLTKYYNKGAFLNALSKKPKVVLALTAVMFGGVVSWLLHRPGWGLALLTGGAASNLTDRIRKGYVVDYFTVRPLPKIVFNLGDIAIFLGAIGMILESMKVDGK